MPETPGEPSHPARPKYDAAYKSLFAHERTVKDTLRALHVATATSDARKRDPDLDDDLGHRLDFATLERMPASFVTEHLGRRHADMLWRIRTFDETWLHLLVLFEFQSTVDPRMAFRMMNYAGGIWLGLDSDHLGRERVFPLIIPVVVYSGRRRWSAPGRRYGSRNWRCRWGTGPSAWGHRGCWVSSGSGSRRCWSCGTVQGAGSWNSDSGTRRRLGCRC